MTEDSDCSVILAELQQLLAPHPEIVGRIALDSQRLITRIENREISITVRVVNDEDLHPSVAHTHIVVETDQSDLRGHLDACIVGMGDDRRTALRNAAESWFTAAAGPIFSLFHAKPVLGATHFDGQDPCGISGAHGFAGPLIVRMASEKLAGDRLIEQPLFQFAPEMAPPGLVHLAKVTLNIHEGRWLRTIEVDGHLAAYVDAAWDAGVAPPRQVVASRFATFHYADQPQAVESRQLLDDIIREYVQVFDRIQDTNQTREMLLKDGRPERIVDRVDHFLVLAFGRSLITSNLPFQPTATYHRVQPSGEMLLDIPLMSEPAFARGMALAQELASGPLLEATKQLALCSAEVGAINSLLNAGSKLEDCRATPFLVPDLGTSEDVFSRAVQHINATQTERAAQKKPWWKIW